MKKHKTVYLTTEFGSTIQFNCDTIICIKPDTKRANISHIKLNILDGKGQFMWFCISHSDLDILNLMYNL